VAVLVLGLAVVGFLFLAVLGYLMAGSHALGQLLIFVVPVGILALACIGLALRALRSPPSAAAPPPPPPPPPRS
jgi:hypothetical protein